MKTISNFFKKHPLLLILGLYLTVLNLLLVQKPRWGDVLFGWDKKQRILEETSRKAQTYVGRIRSLSPSRYGMEAIVSSSEPDIGKINILVYLPSDTDLEVGDTVRVKGKASLPTQATNPGQWDQKSYARLHRIDLYLRPTEAECLYRQGRRSVFYWLWCSRDAVNAKIGMLYQSPYNGILQAMLTGDKSMMEEDEKDLFSQAGISHIVAISGLHLSILVSFLEKREKGGMTSRKQRRIKSGILFLYAFWTGGSAATMRSALMVGIRTEAVFVSRKPDPVNTVALSILLQLIFQPILWVSPAFWLSYGALIGLKLGTVFLMRIRKVMRRPILPMAVFKRICPSLGILIFTFPLVKSFFDHASILSFLLNLWVIPAMQLVLLLGIFSVALSFIYLPLGLGFAYLCQLLLKSFEWGSKIVIDLESSIFPSSLLYGRPEIYQTVLYYGILLLIFFLLEDPEILKKGRWMLKKAVSLTVLIILLLYLILPSHRWRVTFLDVGQGDAAVIEWEGKVILIDAGPSYKKVILPYLKSRGICSIDLAILSHPDKDHMEGLLLLAEEGEIPVRTLYLADQKVQETEERSRLEQLLLNQGTKVKKVKAGKKETLTSGRRTLMIDVLFPEEELSSANASSLTVLIRFNEYSFLFPGDIEQEEEEMIVKKMKGNVLFDDPVLKAAHHGSDTSTKESFLDLTRPSFVVISCGRNNQYGHPSPYVLSRLEERKIPYRVTAQSGAVYVQGFGKKRHFYTFLRTEQNQ